MALVSYEGSSESESELNEENDKEKDKELKTDTFKSNIFTNLPKPKTIDNVVEEKEDMFLSKKPFTVEQSKKSKQPVKIGIPAIKDYDSDDDLEEKPKQKEIKSSGLFSILPPPRGEPLSNKSFVPNVLLRPKQTVVNKVKKKPVKIPQKYLKDEKPNEKNNETDDEDDIDVPETFDDALWENVCGRKKPVVSKRKIIEETDNAGDVMNDNVQLAPEPKKPYTGLDNVAFKELVGTHKRRNENIKLVDVNEEDILPDKDQWLVKSLTDPNYAPKVVITDPVNDTCKRKHHITYLAQQAKANEQELQSQWSQSKFTRKQTQSKYGF